MYHLQNEDTLIVENVNVTTNYAYKIIPYTILRKKFKIKNISYKIYRVHASIKNIYKIVSCKI